MTELSTDVTENTEKALHAMRRMLAREAMQSGRLPDRLASRMWGGPGDGTACPVCHLPALPEHTAYELEFADRDGAVVTSFLHIPCYWAWTDECATGNDQGQKANGKHVNGSGRSFHEDSR